MKSLIFLKEVLAFTLFFTSSFCYANSDFSLENGLRLKSADGKHNFHLGGYLLFDARFVDDTKNSNERFDLFNAWIHMVGSSYDTYDYKIQYSLEDSNATKLRDAYIAFRFTPQFRLRLGQYDMPTIAEHLSALSYSPLGGRAITDSLTPGRDVGAMGEGTFSKKQWNYSLGLFNGNGIDAKSEENDNKDVAGRMTGLIYQSKNSLSTQIYTDISFTYGKQKFDSFNFKSESGEVMLSATDVSVNQRLRIAGGLYGYFGSDSLKATYLRNRYEFSTTNQTGVTSAWSILYTHSITGEREEYRSGVFNKINPKRNFLNGTGGAWQLVVRFSEWNANSSIVQAANSVSVSTVAADKAKAISLGVNLILTPNARINLSWIHTKFDRVALVLPNDSQDSLVARFALQFF